MPDVSFSSGGGEVCVPNLGPRERAKRLRSGIVAGIVTASVAIALVALHAPRVVRLAIFLPALAAALGFFQAREST